MCRWVGECLVVGQSHFKTFDNKFFTFTGQCQYLLTRDCKDKEFSVIIENVQVWMFFFYCQTVLACVSTRAHKFHCFFVSQSAFGCCVSVCRWSGCCMHTLSDAQPGLSGGHDSEAEAWRNCLCKQHGHPDPNASWYTISLFTVHNSAVKNDRLQDL